MPTEEVWTPRMTVSAVIERDGRYLMVEELEGAGQLVLNQPAGHLEEHESLLQAVRREVLEETGHQFLPMGFTGLYRWRASPTGPTFMRLNFVGSVSAEAVTQELDADIIATHWLGLEQLAARRHRSPLVMRCIEDALQRPHLPLSALIDQD